MVHDLVAAAEHVDVAGELRVQVAHPGPALASRMAAATRSSLSPLVWPAT